MEDRAVSIEVHHAERDGASDGVDRCRTQQESDGVASVQPKQAIRE